MVRGNAVFRFIVDIKDFVQKGRIVSQTLHDIDSKSTRASGSMDRFSSSTANASKQSAAAAVNFQTMTQGMLNLTTAGVQTFTSFSNLDRAGNRLAMAQIGVARATDLLTAKELRLQQQRESGGDPRKIAQLEQEIATARADLIVKTDKLKIEEGALLDIQLLFATNIANVVISSIQTIATLRQAEIGTTIKAIIQHRILNKVMETQSVTYSKNAIATTLMSNTHKTATVSARGLALAVGAIGGPLIAITLGIQAYQENWLGFGDAVRKVLPFLEDKKDLLHDVQDELAKNNQSWKDATKTVKTETDKQLQIVTFWKNKQTEIMIQGIRERAALVRETAGQVANFQPNFRSGGETAQNGTKVLLAPGAAGFINFAQLHRFETPITNLAKGGMGGIPGGHFYIGARPHEIFPEIESRFKNPDEQLFRRMLINQGNLKTRVQQGEFEAVFATVRDPLTGEIRDKRIFDNPTATAQSLVGTVEIPKTVVEQIEENIESAERRIAFISQKIDEARSIGAFIGPGIYDELALAYETKLLEENLLIEAKAREESRTEALKHLVKSPGEVNIASSLADLAANRDKVRAEIEGKIRKKLEGLDPRSTRAITLKKELVDVARLRARASVNQAVRDIEETGRAGFGADLISKVFAEGFSFSQGGQAMTMLRTSQRDEFFANGAPVPRRRTMVDLGLEVGRAFIGNPADVMNAQRMESNLSFMRELAIRGHSNFGRSSSLKDFGAGFFKSTGATAAFQTSHVPTPIHILTRIARQDMARRVNIAAFGVPQDFSTLRSRNPSLSGRLVRSQVQAIMKERTRQLNLFGYAGVETNFFAQSQRHEEIFRQKIADGTVTPHEARQFAILQNARRKAEEENQQNALADLHLRAFNIGKGIGFTQDQSVDFILNTSHSFDGLEDYVRWHERLEAASSGISGI